jgi:hypothetical protein
MDKGNAMNGSAALKASLALVLLSGLAGCQNYGGHHPGDGHPVEVIPAQVCGGNADSDGDGVTDCFDRCSNTLRGQQVDPDGCPVPEPPMEPKPYRG